MLGLGAGPGQRGRPTHCEATPSPMGILRRESLDLDSAQARSETFG